MVAFRQSGCIRANVFLFGQSGCIRGKVVVIGQSGCNQANVVVIWQKWLCSGKEWMYSDKVGVLGQK